MSLDRPHLELLAALTEATTLAAASTEIGLSPSAASRRLREAERRVDTQLVEVDGRTLRLTVAGQVLADSAMLILDQLAEAELTARWLGAADTAPIRIGVGFHDDLAWGLPHPDTLSVEIIRSPTRQAADALVRRRVDLTIDVAGAGLHDGRTLIDDHLTLVVGPNHRLAGRPSVGAADIEDERYLASDPTPLPGFELEHLFLPSGHSPRHIVRVESFAAAMRLIERGHGISIQPLRSATGIGRSALRVVPLDREIPMQWFAKRGDRQHDETDRALDLIEAAMGTAAS